MQIAIGEIFRDTYYDGKQPDRTKRTVKVLEVLPNGVRAEVLTNVRGEPAHGRKTTIQFKTLRAGYEPVIA